MRNGILLAAGLILVGGLLYFSSSAVLHVRRAVAPEGKPIIEFPAHIDLGGREVGEYITVPISISNRGNAELAIWDIRTNCSCSGLERRDSDGRNIRIDSLTLAAGEHVDLAMRVVVRGDPGAAASNLVLFQTNDTQVGEGRIRIEVSQVLGGAIATPAGYFFGTALVGDDCRQIIEIRDLAPMPRRIVSAACSDTDSVTARTLPIDSGRPGVAAGPGQLIGRLELIVNTDKPRNVAAKVHLQLDKSTVAPDGIPISGRVANIMEASPASLVLPRMSGEGPVFRATCIVRSTQGKPVTLVLESVPFGITAQLLEGVEGATARVVQISWDYERAKHLAGAPALCVRLKANIGAKTESIVIPITCTEAPLGRTKSSIQSR